MGLPRVSAEAIRESGDPEPTPTDLASGASAMTLVAPRAAAIDLSVVLAGVTAGITVQDDSGRLIYANPLAATMAGFRDPDELLAASPGELVARFQLVDERGALFDPSRLPGRRVLRGESPDPVLVGFRPVGGEERWSMLHARTTVLEDGRHVAVNTFHDVTTRIEAERRVRDRERRFREMAEERRRAEDRLESVLRHMPVGVVLADPDGRVLFANAAVRRMSLVPVEVGVAPNHRLRGVRPDGTQLDEDAWPLPRALRGESVENDIITAESDTGIRRTYNLSASPMRDRDGAINAAILTVVDVTERVVAQEREHFLARASEVLASSLDYEQTVRTVADLVVPHFADWCVVQVADEAGKLQRIAVAHRDPEKVALARASANDYPEDPDSPNSAASILRDGHTVYVPDITPEQLDAAARDDRHREILRAISLRSALSVPLIVGGRVTGVLSLVNGESGRRFEPDDVAFAENLAGRAAAAIENARLFREGVRFQRLLDATSDAVLLIDVETRRIVYANEGAVLQFDRPVDDLVGTGFDEHLDDVGAFTLRVAFE
ncbi:MAG TPA: PAS domain-containing protein, partial [Candidatus Limnocylindrales bacterium]|nr:PAS domain-containing protein [Candidatus Limnocylindrales bacterium]